MTGSTWPLRGPWKMEQDMDGVRPKVVCGHRGKLGGHIVCFDYLRTWAWPSNRDDAGGPLDGSADGTFHFVSLAAVGKGLEGNGHARRRLVVHIAPRKLPG